MFGVAAFGAMAGLVGVVVGWLFINGTERTARRSIDLAVEAVSSASDTVDVARNVVANVDQGLASLRTATSSLTGTFTQSQQVFSTVASLTGGQLPDAIQSINDTLPTIATAGDTIDRALRALSRSPFGISYNPSVPFGDAVRRLGDGLAPLPGQLRTVAAQLQDVANRSTGLDAQLAAVDKQLEGVAEQVTAASRLLDEYAKTASDARRLADTTQQDVNTQLRNGRLLVVAIGLAFIGLMAVPAWLGLALRSGVLSSQAPLIRETS
ncbi:MAG: hypothetical protein AB7L13_06045 [Acidimicrobiia bacterium]